MFLKKNKKGSVWFLALKNKELPALSTNLTADSQRSDIYILYVGMHEKDEILGLFHDSYPV